MRTLVLALLLVSTAALAPLAAAGHTGCSPNGYGYTCHVNVLFVCEEMDFRVGQPSTWYTCTDWPDLLS